MTCLVLSGFRSLWAFRSLLAVLCMHRQRMFVVVLVTFSILGCGPPPISSAPEPTNELSWARMLFDEGNVAEAEAVLSGFLIRFPTDADALFLACQIRVSEGELSGAEEMMKSMKSGSAQFVDAVNLVASAFQEEALNRDAERVLRVAFETGEATEEVRLRWLYRLWDLLNRSGRRQEASLYADLLVKRQFYAEDLLQSLLRRGESFPLAFQSDAEAEAYFEHGLGYARYLFSQGRYNEALGEIAREEPESASASSRLALEGRLLAEIQASDAEFSAWHARCDAEVRRFANYWAAIGIWCFQTQEHVASARALCEAVELDPTDDDACHRLARVLAALNREQDAAYVREHAIRVATMRGLLKKINLGQGSSEMTSPIPQQLIELGRPLESIGWALQFLSTNQVEQKQNLLRQHAAISQKPELDSMSREVALLEIAKTDFEIDREVWERLSSRRPSGLGSTETTIVDSSPGVDGIRLEDVAEGSGLHFQWYHAPVINLESLPLHQMMGGGVAILDFDRNGYPDVYQMQGSGRPPGEVGELSNRLSRNLGGFFQDVTSASGSNDYQYGTGVAAGDINQDGFTDLFLGNLGPNRLLLNNGDGTFSDVTVNLNTGDDRFTSSVAIADLTDDGLPELFECLYVEMEDGFRGPDQDADGGEIPPSPNDFYAESDRWFLSKGDGLYLPETFDSDLIQPGTSLGLVIGDFTGSGSNSVFVSNDARPNHFLTGFSGDRVVNQADLRGLSVGFRGFSNSCMGIAAGDFNRDGRIDFHLSNFVGEPANHFVQGKNQLFSDAAERYQVAGLTEPFTGFGMAAIDFKRNGLLDLVVANGHVFDVRPKGQLFQMPTQVLLNLRERFSSVENSGGQYLSERFVGRTVTKIDYDRDLDWDLIIGHLDRPTALLQNNTVANGDAIQFVLVGTASEREAIGAQVRVVSSTGEFVEWLTAGDGYLTSNQKLIDIGLGPQADIEKVVITWPSGLVTTLLDLEVNHRYVVVEGAEEIWWE